MRRMKKSITIIASFMTIITFALVLSLFQGVTVSASTGTVKLSKEKVTFKSPKAKAQTITIKNVKASNVKEIRVDNMWDEWFSIKPKGKNKIVIKPKRSSGDIEYGVSVTVEYKKPVNGRYTEYLTFKEIRINGNSTIKIKNADDLCSMCGGTYSIHRWKYVLENDIDMTGRGMAKRPGEYGGNDYSDIYLDGKGHSIKSDSIIFSSVSGVIKNVVFDMNIDTALSKKDNTTEALKKTVYNSTYGGIAPIVYNNGLIENCVVKGNITVDIDQELEYYGYDGKTLETTSWINIAGLVEENTRSESLIRRCRSDVNITAKVSDPEKASFCQIYAGGFVAENYGYSGTYANIEECEFNGSINIINCSTFHYAGGIHAWGNGNVADCINRGTVHSDTDSMIKGTGGISGEGAKSVKRVINVGNADSGLFGWGVSEVNLENGVLPDYEDSYWLKSKSNGFNYSGDPFEVPGTHGITDEELLQTSTFHGFDFDKVWKMGANGPELRGLPTI